MLAAPTLTTPAQAQEDVDLVTILTAPDAQTQLDGHGADHAVDPGRRLRPYPALRPCRRHGPSGCTRERDGAAGASRHESAGPDDVQFMDQTGTEVEVCAIYLPNKGVGEEALIEGVTAADPAVMGERLVAPHARIMSF